MFLVKINFQLDFEHSVTNTKKYLEDFQKDILLKANIKDVCTLLDTKSSMIYFICYFLIKT